MPNKKDKSLGAFGKSHLPEKRCVVCKRPMLWRKKWEKVWEHVKYCSDACRRGTPR
jgi:hypothetical protein